jgi:hypothetical protein
MVLIERDFLSGSINMKFYGPISAIVIFALMLSAFQPRYAKTRS